MRVTLCCSKPLRAIRLPSEPAITLKKQKDPRGLLDSLEGLLELLLSFLEPVHLHQGLGMTVEELVAQMIRVAALGS